MDSDARECINHVKRLNGRIYSCVYGCVWGYVCDTHSRPSMYHNHRIAHWFIHVLHIFAVRIATVRPPAAAFPWHNSPGRGRTIGCPGATRALLRVVYVCVCVRVFCNNPWRCIQHTVTQNTCTNNTHLRKQKERTADSVATQSQQRTAATTTTL